MMTKLTVFLSDQERAILQAMAERDMRGLREQARYLIVKALTAEGNGVQHGAADLAPDKPKPCEVTHVG